MEQNGTMAPRGPALNGYQLKLAALVLMTVDHLAAYHSFPMSDAVYTAMRMVGRIAAPLFLFMVVEGLRHTRSRGRYLLRLYLAGLLIDAVNAGISAATDGLVEISDILPTFFYVALFVCCIDALRSRPRPAVALAAVCGLTLPFGLAVLYAHLFFRGPYRLYQWLRIPFPSPLAVEYSILFVLMGVAWYYIRDKRGCALLLLGMALLSHIVPLRVFTLPQVTRIPLLTPRLFTAYHLFAPTQWCMAFALIPMLCYNGERGRSMKYLFYLYYPLHQYLCLLLGLIWK